LNLTCTLINVQVPVLGIVSYRCEEVQCCILSMRGGTPQTGPLRGDAPKGGGVPIQVVLENPIHTIMETVTNEVVAATKGTVVAHTTKELKREKNISLGFEAEQSKENVELGSITFEPSARALSKKENAKLWLFADMEHRANKLGYEEQTWVNLGILESRPAEGGGFDLVLLFERVGMREGVVYGA